MGAEAPYAALNNHTPLRGEQQATVYDRLSVRNKNKAEKVKEV